MQVVVLVHAADLALCPKKNFSAAFRWRGGGRHKKFGVNPKHSERVFCAAPLFLVVL